jgi:hypothetical protein
MLSNERWVNCSASGAADGMVTALTLAGAPPTPTQKRLSRRRRTTPSAAQFHMQGLRPRDVSVKVPTAPVVAVQEMVLERQVSMERSGDPLPSGCEEAPLSGGGREEETANADGEGHSAAGSPFVLRVEEEVLCIAAGGQAPQLSGTISLPSRRTWDALPQPCLLGLRGSSLQSLATVTVAAAAGRASKSPQAKDQFDVVLKPDARAAVQDSASATDGIPVVRYRLRRLRFMPIRVRKNVQKKGNGMVMLSIEIAANTALVAPLAGVSIVVSLPSYPTEGARQPACKPGAEWNRGTRALRWPAKTAGPLSLSPGAKVVVQALLPLAATVSIGTIAARCRCAELLSDVQVRPPPPDDLPPSSPTFGNFDDSQPATTAMDPSASQQPLKMDVRGTLFRVNLPGDSNAKHKPAPVETAARRGGRAAGTSTSMTTAGVGAEGAGATAPATAMPPPSPVPPDASQSQIHGQTQSQGDKR